MQELSKLNTDRLAMRQTKLKTKCDVIWKIPVYGGANSVFLDQPLP